MLLSMSVSRTVRTLLIAGAVVVSLAPLRAQDYTATVLDQVGQVSVTTNLHADMRALFKGMPVKPMELIVTGPDGYARFQVSDGSTFEVFSNARVVFRPSLGNWKDLLNVWIGRVKVMIQHEPGKPNPNEVSSPTAVISVRGTVFDVVVEDDDGTTLVIVDEGIVDVRNMTAPGGRVVLSRGDFVRVFRNQQLALAQIDKGNVLRIFLEKSKELAVQVLMQRSPAGIATGPGGIPSGAQGDKSKPSTTNGTKGTPGAPGTPPAPGAPPVPPGGGN